MRNGCVPIALFLAVLLGPLSAGRALGEHDVSLKVGDTVRLERDGCPGAMAALGNIVRGVFPGRSAIVVTVDNLKDLKGLVGQRVRLQEVFDRPQHFPDRYITRTYFRRSWDTYPTTRTIRIESGYTVHWRQLYRNGKGETFAAYVHTNSQNVEGVLSAVHEGGFLSGTVDIRNDNGEETRVIVGGSSGQRLLVTQKMGKQ